MTDRRTTLATATLAVGAGTAALTVVVHHGLTVEYGDVAAPLGEVVLRGPAAGLVVLGLLLTALLGMVAALVAPVRWVRATAAVLPVALVVGVVAVTPSAVAQKIEDQYSAAPRCLAPGAVGPGTSPGLRAARASQRAYDAVDHVGLFGGGGGSGVGGCDRGFVVLDEVDVLSHYRLALPDAGWRVVEDRDGRLRAERGRMALEVHLCPGGGHLWAGWRRLDPATACEGGSTVVGRP